MHIRTSDYERLTYREIRHRLHAEGRPESEIEHYILLIREARHVRSNEKRRIKEHKKRWAEVIAALQHERRIVRGMVRYKTKTPAPERDDFVQRYYQVLTALYEELLAKRHIEQVLPEHDHWTDFVDDSIKAKFIKRAHAIPQRDKSKFKEPFQRTSPAALADLRRGRLLRYTRATLETLLTRIDENPDDPKLERKEQLLREAIKRINAMPQNAHIPNHWADVVRDMLRAGDDTGMVDRIKNKPSKKRGASVTGQPRGSTATLAMLNGQKQSEIRRMAAMARAQPLGMTVAKLLSVQPKDTKEQE